MSVIYFYSHEVQPGYEFSPEEMEINKKEMIQSMIDSKKMDETNMVALKVSAVGSFLSLKAWNASENKLTELFKSIDKESKQQITIKQVYK